VLLTRPDRILSRDQLLELSRLRSTDVYDRSIDAQILRLLRKIEANPSKPELMRTERGLGYRFGGPVAIVHQAANLNLATPRISDAQGRCRVKVQAGC
jgi:DNA-binding winged helix-turn-helix (wHTH) protein